MTIMNTLPELTQDQQSAVRTLLSAMTGIDWTCLSRDQIRERFEAVMSLCVDLVIENYFCEKTIALQKEVEAIYSCAYSCAYDLPAPTDSPDELPF